MVLDSISKIGKLTMKKLIIFCWIVTLICILQSCTDSLGVDPKYQVEPDNPDTELGDGSQNQFSIDSVIANMLEYYKISGTTYSDNWINPSLNSKYVQSDIKIDTTDSQVKIWMKLNLSNPSAGKPLSADRKDRIVMFQISFKAILEDNKLYTLDGNNIDTWKWASVLIESKSNNNLSTFKSYEGNQLISQISFQNVGKTYINVNLTLDLTPIGILETQNLLVQFTIPVSNNK